MYQNIRAHLDFDEQTQTAIESNLSSELDLRQRQNIRAFKLYAPNVLAHLNRHSEDAISVFLNQSGQMNFVDVTTGSVFYGQSPRQEVEEQYRTHIHRLPFVEFHSTTIHPPQEPTEISECVVVLGVGLGYHLQRLINDYTIRHLVIYEPETSLFKGSLLSCDWREILKAAQQKNTSIYFQVGESGANIISDLTELIEHTNASSVYIYKHCNNTVFNAIQQEFLAHSWAELKSKPLPFNLYQTSSLSLPRWTRSLQSENFSEISPLDDHRFQQNMIAFKEYFPDLANQFGDYKPKQWLPMRNAAGSVELVHKTLAEVYSVNGAEQDGHNSYETFKRFPNKDGLILGYDGEKLKAYTHYRFVKATEVLLEDTEEKRNELPENVQSLILFGLLQGYSLQELTAAHEVQNLFICEPDPDFFYASLFALDWSSLLKDIDATERRIYLNIGDNGENLFRDLLNQFYAIGPYMLANTFFYQGYFRSDLVDAVNHLREQLQVVIAMGECFDHARFGITHTSALINDGAKFLIKNASTSLSLAHRDVPVFVVGNGPSLDQSIELIKAERENVIVVSCGTALQVLYRSGITPDFHAEIEQNRATFDWNSRINAFEFLKSITLLSCNGIHPHTAALFKDTMLAFKEGESSTVSAQKLLADEWATLEFAFPTVTNFVVNLFLELGFHQLYFLGVDLGFIDWESHHSKLSGYYDDKGVQLYDYKRKNRSQLLVAGNFRKVVSTKYEFKIAKDILELSLRSHTVESFNCSDGARIAGTSPLRLEDVLITSSPTEQQSALAAIKTNCFKGVGEQGDYQQKFGHRYSLELLKKEIAHLISLTTQCLADEIDVESLISQTKVTLHNSYQSGRSLLFYLIYGSSNYAHAVFSKLISLGDSADSDGGEASPLMKAVHAWQKMLRAVESEYLCFANSYDFAHSLHHQREQIYLERNLVERRTMVRVTPNYQEKTTRILAKVAPKLVVVDNQTNTADVDALLIFMDTIPLDQVHQDLRMAASTEQPPQIVIVTHDLSAFQGLRQTYESLNLAMVFAHDAIRCDSQVTEFLTGNRSYYVDPMHVMHGARAVEEELVNTIVIPKLTFVENYQERNPELLQLVECFSEFNQYIEFPYYLYIPFEAAIDAENLVDKAMNAGRPVGHPILLEALIRSVYPLDKAETFAQQLRDGLIPLITDDYGLQRG
ncbi:DUF115 domain-containing protein [Alteromonas sp. ASW11-36]|uniref:DUF115 domain-containing protein n=1 Tax=Alteromonas arenosi TaxID=3055817 RepID=A0ABT7SVC1_9ALTE|nr:6-hydroxymethylpterin diphosphokinase MptE-like protein [Alteromonas sp. ASW11-36]MDM7860141.1 DUF115 domain-containing protein [Alteromonas sp. ASW11-36]